MYVFDTWVRISGGECAGEARPEGVCANKGVATVRGTTKETEHRTGVAGQPANYVSR
jgi:hypothetical protein